MNKPLIIFDLLVLPITICRIVIIFFMGSKYNIPNMGFFDILQHAEKKFFNTICCTEQSIEESINESSKTCNDPAVAGSAAAGSATTSSATHGAELGKSEPDISEREIDEEFSDEKSSVFMPKKNTQSDSKLDSSDKAVETISIERVINYEQEIDNLCKEALDSDPVGF